TAKLVPYRAVGNNATLFDQTTARERPLLDPAEAARWLVALHAYDTGGLKTPYGREKSSERAPCNNFGCVLVEGPTLKDTLLLNMPVYNPAREEPAPTTRVDRPAWEENPPRPEPEMRSPLGWTDLLTWPSRRILLSPQESPTGTVVDGVIVTPGTRLRGDLPEMELMAAFHRPPARGRSRALRPLLPVRLRERRGVWRHSAELLLAGDQDRQRPRALDHLAERVRAGLIPEHSVYTLRVFGQQLDKNFGAIECWFEEAVPAPVALLRAESSRVGAIIGLGVRLADDVGSALRRMERDYCTEFGAEPSSGLDLLYWPHLPQPFGVFLRQVAEALRAEQSETTALEAWSRAVRGLAYRAADKWAYGSPRHNRGLFVAGKQHASFTGLLDYLIKRFHAETTAFIAARE
ncbi:MAG: type I-E CRISPR-associated protein Cse1/CasA, partial [bacterium]